LPFLLLLLLWFCFALSPGVRIAKRCISLYILLVLRFVCAIDFGLLASARLRPSFIQGALRFRQCSLASVGFLLLVREHHNEKKNP
jgi:hypothetical protein